MTERTIKTLCVGCLAPCSLAESLVRAAIADKPRTTFYCNDDLAIPGVAIERPEGACSCGNPRLIVITGPDDDLWIA